MPLGHRDPGPAGLRVTAQPQLRPVVDLTEEEARRALVLKWGTMPPGVLPAWVAEMDYALDPVVHDALIRAVHDGVTGYPTDPEDSGLGKAYAGFADRHFGWPVDPGWVLPVVDVTAGVRVAIDVLSERAPVVFPTPGYSPQFAVPALTGRQRVDLPVEPDADRAEIDLDRLDALFAAGARTLMLTQPHNPWGRAFTREELEGVRDVVLRHGARVVSDEIHAPLVLPGAEHVPYLSLEGTADHAVAVVASSKAFNTAGLRCAQLVTPDPVARAALRHEPMARNDSWSPLGVVAAVAAYDEGDPWLASLVERLDGPARPARRPARHPPARGADASAGGDVPGLAGRARLRTCRPGRGRPGPRTREARAGARLPPRRRGSRQAQPRHQSRAADRDRAAAGHRLDLRLSRGSPDRRC